jgi:hypothetical protein
MSDESKLIEGPPSHDASGPEGKGDLARPIGRFAQYTSPIMLAMLASAAKSPALAATFT